MLFVGVGFVVVGISALWCVVRYMVFLLLGMFRVVLGCCPGFRGIVVERKVCVCRTLGYGKCDLCRGCRGWVGSDEG